MVGTGRLGPKPRPHPDLGLSIFQDSDYGPAAEDVPNSGDSAGGAAPYGRSADASVQPLRFASLGFNPYPPHYPTSKASSFFFSSFFLSTIYLSLFLQHGSTYETDGGSGGCGAQQLIGDSGAGWEVVLSAPHRARLGEGARG